VGPWREAPGTDRAETLDLGETLLLPGLVNAHCHLDYTHMAGKIPPLKHFTDWIKAIVSLKSGWSYTEFADSWLAGAQMLAQSGTTTVADIEAVPELLPDAWNATALRVHSFREMIHIKPRPVPSEMIEAALSQCSQNPQAAGRFGLSPHAPYSTSPCSSSWPPRPRAIMAGA
jgi:cytosine/adenosine deaminase-related metal-dependent hydrolase